MNPVEALALEHGMWKAAQNRDAEEFLQLVSPEAIMVCGGFRCTGGEYSEIIRAFDCKAYRIDNFEIVHETDDSFQVHYVLHMDVEQEENRDLAGDVPYHDHVEAHGRNVEGDIQYGSASQLMKRRGAFVLLPIMQNRPVIKHRPVDLFRNAPE